MRYHVTIAGQTRTVEIDGESVTVDGKPVRAELQRIDGTFHSLLLDEKPWTLDARPNDSPRSWIVHALGTEMEVEVVDERTRAIREMTRESGHVHGPKPVRAPMPGLIVRIDVEAGQSVSAGQGVAVIEAMKMENELKALSDAVVSRVLVSSGQAVEKGAVLVEFQEAE